jgi:asparagine synthase (glutamine-hydrolysing)
MCAICGVVSHAPRGDLGAIASRMSAAMTHRGPDDGGAVVGDRVALGMRRLSIIDRAGGHQPMLNEDGDVAVICNGEIYNFNDLRVQLEALGHRFRARSDTEVIVHAYEQWDDGCLSRLRGMFALAILDRRERAPNGASPGRARLLLARDRLGIKPLYYASVDGLVLFASEVRGLLASAMVPRTLSREGLESYLIFGSVSEPVTMVEGVHSLPPGHMASVAVNDRQPAEMTAPTPYWTLPAAGESAPSTEAAGALRALLEDSIRLHLASDEPLGVFLSGGIDSTAVAALARGVNPDVRCYTVTFDEPAFDEAAQARETARQLGVAHQELPIRPAEMLETLDSALDALDQPSVDGINTFCVSRAVRAAGVKVALSGIGGDELFGGYRTFRWNRPLEHLSAIAVRTPGPVRRIAGTLVDAAGAVTGRSDDSDRLAALCRHPDALPHPFFFARSIFGPGEVEALIGPRAAGAPRRWRQWNDESARRAAGLDDFAAVSLFEIRSYLLNTLLRDADAMSMAHSLELRVPLLDHPLVEYVIGQPQSLKRQRRRYKPLVVDALGELLPPGVATRPKRGFTFPWSRWMHGPLRPRLQADLESFAPIAAARLDARFASRTLESFERGRCGWLRPWSLFVLNHWVRRHLQG